MKILLAQINPTIGDFSGNTEKIVGAMARAKGRGADLVVFPELAITGYPPEDFLLMPHFVGEVQRHLEEIVAGSKGIAAVVGLPRINGWESGKPLCNSAAVIDDGKLLGFQDKALLPTYDVFSERRYFAPAREFFVWELAGRRVVVTICEDIWNHAELIKEAVYPRDPIDDIISLAPELLVNISASPFSIHKVHGRNAVCSSAAKKLGCPLVLCNQVGANDSLIFDGHSVYCSADGAIISMAKGFCEDDLFVDTGAVASQMKVSIDDTADLYSALVLGVRDYFHKSGFTSACLGLSGGIDSAVVAAIAADALEPNNVLTVAMPSRYSSSSSVADALALAKNLGVELWEVPIEGPFQAYLDLLDPFFSGHPRDVTEENLQARIRGMIMMAISNKLGYVGLATGNKSEMAMGFATLYGDMCGGLGIISDVTKSQVYMLADWINRRGEVIPRNIITKAPSAELKEGQKDSDTLPDYSILDNVLEAYVEKHLSIEEIVKKYGYDEGLVSSLVTRIHRNEYKRRQGAPGLRVSAKSFSVGRHFPIVQEWV